MTPSSGKRRFYWWSTRCRPTILRGGMCGAIPKIKIGRLRARFHFGSSPTTLSNSQLLETVPGVLGPGREPDLEWRESDGERHAGAAVIVVSNNPYRFGPPVREPTRPRLDAGVLGVVVLDRGNPRTWSTPSFEVDAHSPVQADKASSAFFPAR